MVLDDSTVECWILFAAWLCYFFCGWTHFQMLLLLALSVAIAGTTIDLDAAAAHIQNDLDAATNILLHANAFTHFRVDGHCGGERNHGCDPSSMKTCCTPEGTCEVTAWSESQCVGEGFHDHADHDKCRGGDGYARPKFYDPAVEFPCAHRDVRADQTYKAPTHVASAYFDAPINEGKKQTVELQSLLAAYKQRKIASALKIGRGVQAAHSSKEGAAAIAKLTSLGEEAEEVASRLAEHKRSMGIETSHTDFINFVKQSSAHLNALHAVLGAEDDDLNKIIAYGFHQLRQAELHPPQQPEPIHVPLCGDILLVVKSSTAKTKYVDRLRKILETYGTFCAHRITALTDDADLPALKRVQRDFPSLNVEIVRDDAAFGAYHDGSLGNEHDTEVAQAKKTTALFQFYQRVALSVLSTKALWLCYLDDDMYANIPALQAELKTAAGWIGDTSINQCEHYISDHRIRYTLGGWCMDRSTADAIAAYTINYAPKAYVDDTGFTCNVLEYFKNEKQQHMAPKDSNAWFSEYSVPVKSLGDTAALDKATLRYWKEDDMIVDWSLSYSHTEQGEGIAAERKDSLTLDRLREVSVIHPSRSKKAEAWESKLALRVGSTNPTDVWGNWHKLVMTNH